MDFWFEKAMCKICKLFFVSKTGIRKFCDHHYYADFAYYFANL